MKLYLDSFKIMIKHSKLWGILYIAVSVFNALLISAQLILLQNFINQLMENNIKINTPIIFSLFILIFSYVLQVVLSFFITYIDIRSTKLLTKNMNDMLFNKINKIDYACYENEKMYNIIQRMGDSPQDKIKSVFLSSLNTLNAFIVLFGVSLVFFQVSYLLTLSLIIVLFGVIFCSTKGMNILNSTIREQTVDERMLNYYNGLLFDKNSVFELKIFKAIPYIIRLRKAIEKLVLKKLFKRSLQADLIYNLSTVLIVAWVIFSLFYTGGLVVKGYVSIGLFVALIQASIAIIGNVETLAYSFSDTIQSIELVSYYYEFTKLPERNIHDLRYEKKLKENNIIFDCVSFKYPGTENYILKNVSFKIEGTEKVAIVGANGAGKSTIIKLLLNLYSVDKGEIRSNVNVLSPVFQDYVKYYLTLRENIALSDVKNIDDDNIILESLAKGQAIDILGMSNKKLDMNLGKIADDGIDISGGQWQRLAVSRSFFPKDAYIIFDEPTASMDPIAESQMYDYFLQTLNNQGCLIISHRLASAKLADKILVIDDSFIVEEGTHIELMASKGLYFKMFSAQSSWYTN